jgi:hypothetical protein
MKHDEDDGEGQALGLSGQARLRKDHLLDNPLLRKALRPEHIKPRLLGHWGTTPGLNFIYAHLNRVIKARDRRVRRSCRQPSGRTKQGTAIAECRHLP